MSNEEYIKQMSEFLDEFDNLIIEYVEDCGWNANEVFQAYLNIGCGIAEKMVGCAKIPKQEVRERFIGLINASLNRCFDELENEVDKYHLN